MIFEKLPLSGAYIIRVKKIEDDRGFFARTWCKKEFYAHGLTGEMAQANMAYSRYRGTLRGMHYQQSPHAEAKLFRCIRGSIYDVMIDLIPDSPTFKCWFAIEIDEKSNTLIYIPQGFAHGYMTLTDHTEVFYHVSAYYTPEAEKGIRWNDPTFQIKWPNMDNINISVKDQKWPDFITNNS